MWRVTGIWSHFACSDEPDHAANAAQERAFRDALAGAERAGLRPEVRHLANSAGAILRLLARAGTTGLRASELSRALYGDEEHQVTVRAEISRLRRQVGAIVATSPYRIAEDVELTV